MKDFILNHNQKKILKSLAFLRKYGAYLAGGTALAMQLGHRTSKDLDFYTRKHFESKEVLKDFRRNFGKQITEFNFAEDTLKLKLKITDFSLFRYNYPLIRPLIVWESIKLAREEDIAAMKIEAIRHRGLKRDFADIYFLIEKYGVEKLLEFTQEKYPQEYNRYSCIVSLGYFEDAEKKEQGRFRLYLYKNISWLEIKKGIEKAIKEYQLKLIKQND